MFEINFDADVRQLQSITDVAALHRRRRYSYRKNVCLITANGSLNGINILNILNGFGGL